MNWGVLIVIIFTIIYIIGQILYRPVSKSQSGSYKYIIRNKKLRYALHDKNRETREEEWRDYLITINSLRNKYSKYNIDKSNWSNNRYLLKCSWEEIDEKIEKLTYELEKNYLEYDKKKTPEENEKKLVENKIKIKGRRNGFV